MKKIRMIKDTNKNKIGDIRELNKERARIWVEKLKIAEYVTARKDKKDVTNYNTE